MVSLLTLDWTCEVYFFSSVHLYVVFVIVLPFSYHRCIVPDNEFQNNVDWDDFQCIPGCQTGRCTEVKEDGKLFLGGTDLREQAEGEKLKSIDDFNKAQSAGGAEAAPVLERLRNAMFEIGIDKELFDQVVEGMKKDYEGSTANESELLAAVSAELGKSLSEEKLRTGFTSCASPEMIRFTFLLLLSPKIYCVFVSLFPLSFRSNSVGGWSVTNLGTKLKAAMKAIAVEQLRIK